VPNRISGYKPPDQLGSLKPSAGGAPAVDKTQAEAPATTAAPAAASADTVTITGPALAMQKLSEAVANAPVVNTQKVASVKRAVQDGTYTIDPQRVADKLLQYENGLK